MGTLGSVKGERERSGVGLAVGDGKYEHSKTMHVN